MRRPDAGCRSRLRAREWRYLYNPTFLKRSHEDAVKAAPRVIKPETSEALRYIMRLNAKVGSASKASLAGYFVGGKTGTAEKVVNGRYSKTKPLHDLHGVHALDAPRYLIVTVYDERAAGPVRRRLCDGRLQCGRHDRKESWNGWPRCCRSSRASSRP